MTEVIIDRMLNDYYSKATRSFIGIAFSRISQDKKKLCWSSRTSLWHRLIFGNTKDFERAIEIFFGYSRSVISRLKINLAWIAASRLCTICNYFALRLTMLALLKAHRHGLNTLDVTCLQESPTKFDPNLSLRKILNTVLPSLSHIFRVELISFISSVHPFSNCRRLLSDISN